MKNIKLYDLTICAIATALVCVFTAFVTIRLPIGGEGGLIHLGNIPLLLFAIICGKKIGMVCGGVGMALFDLLSGYTVWAPFTLVIVGAMGFVMGLFGHKNPTFLNVTIGIVLASKGYPGDYKKGYVIEGADKENIYHMGTKRNENGELVTNGGRVLFAVASGKTLEEANKKANELVDTIKCENLFHRTDIGAKAYRK